MENIDQFKYYPVTMYHRVTPYDLSWQIQQLPRDVIQWIFEDVMLKVGLEEPDAV